MEAGPSGTGAGIPGYVLNLGGIAQLVEHELCKLGATGSSPVASTKRCAGAAFGKVLGIAVRAGETEWLFDAPETVFRGACSSVG